MQASNGNVNAGTRFWPADHTNWRTIFWIVWFVLLAVKLVLAAHLSPFGDEAWYWQESRHLAWGYSDLPPATAWLIRLGDTLFGHGELAMRAPFIALGALLPLLMVRLGRRLFDATAGWCAGLLTMALPLLGTLGLFALPDVPLTFAGVLALDAFERAARDSRRRDWILLGAALALAWLSHYRAAMLLLAGLAFLCLTERGRRLWSRPGLWLALAIACLGLVPILVFNAQHHWVALDFQLLQRNPWRFHADALVQPLEQMLVCTPLFYLLLLWTIWHALRRVPCGAPWDLFAVTALVPIVGYLVLGCFADDTRFRVHWPLPGYLPLLLLMPVLLREHATTAWRRIGVVAALVLLIIGEAVVFAYFTLAAVPDAAAVLRGTKAFPQQFVGWRDVAARTRRLIDQPAYANRVLVAGNFMLAAELEFAFDGSREVYTLDHPINAKHGRAPQLRLWRRDEAGLREREAGKPVLLVVEPTARRERARATWMNSLCTRIADLTPVDKLQAFDGRERYRWFSGVVPVRKLPAPGDCIATQP